MTSDVKKLVTGRFLFSFAISMQAILIGWTMYELTHDPLKLGLIGLAEAVPALGLALWAGYLVDRSRPLVVYRYVLLGSLLSAMVFFASRLFAGHLTLGMQIVALFLSSFITGFARAFAQPSLYATMPRLIPRDELPKTVAWMTSAMQVARISGPGLGGLIYGFWGGPVASGVVSVAIVGAVVSLGMIQAKIPAPASRVGGSVVDELFSGVRYVFGNSILVSALSLDMISVLFGGVTAILPIYAAEILHVGASGLGLLRAAPAIGATITSLALTRIDMRAKAGPLLLSVVAGFGVAILVFAVSENFVLSAVALAVSGGFDSISMVIRGTAVQLCSPESMRGKISAVNSIFIGSSNELGEFESGVAAKLLGTVPSVIFGGTVCLLTVATIAVFAPALRKMDLRKVQAEQA